MTKLEKFLKTTKPHKSVLFDFEDEILQLKDKGYSANKIIEYLRSENVNVTSRNLNYWLKRQNHSSSKKLSSQNNKSTTKAIQTTKTDAKKAVAALDSFFTTSN